ncbi:hypothetical protein PSAC2689_70163 [Paraburkholderia sacchari]
MITHLPRICRARASPHGTHTWKSAKSPFSKVLESSDAFARKDSEIRDTFARALHYAMKVCAASASDGSRPVFVDSCGHAKCQPGNSVIVAASRYSSAIKYVYARALCRHKVEFRRANVSK